MIRLQPKARKVKFRLNIGGREISDIDGLRANFSFAEIKKSISNGQFTRWLEYLGEYDLYDPIEDWRAKGDNDTFTLLKIFFEDYSRYHNVTELVISECMSEQFRRLLPEMLTQPGLDVAEVMKAFETEKDPELMRLLVDAQGSSQAIAPYLSRQKLLALVYGVEKYLEQKKDLLAERIQRPPEEYYPKDFRYAYRNEFVINTTIRIKNQQRPRWFSKSPSRKDLWDYLVKSYTILFNIYVGNNIKKEFLQYAEEIGDVETNNHYFVERRFMAALIYHHYHFHDAALQSHTRNRWLNDIRNRYIPASVLYDNWNNRDVTRSVDFNPYLWPCDSNLLKTNDFLKEKTLGERIALVFSSIFDLSLYR